MIIDILLPSCQIVAEIANPTKFSETKQEYRIAGINQNSIGHTKEVINELGYTYSEIKAFDKEKLVD